MRRSAILLLITVFAVPLWALQDSQDPKEWHARAQADYEVAQLVREKTTHYGHVCFLAHQAVEKSLKGVLISHGIQPDKGHLTADLLAQLAKFRPEVTGFLSDCRMYDRLYVPSRYPKVGLTVTEKQATECLEKAKPILATLQKGGEK